MNYKLSHKIKTFSDYNLLKYHFGDFSLTFLYVIVLDEYYMRIIMNFRNTIVFCDVIFTKTTKIKRI